MSSCICSCASSFRLQYINSDRKWVAQFSHKSLVTPSFQCIICKPGYLLLSSPACPHYTVQYVVRSWAVSGQYQYQCPPFGPSKRGEKIDEQCTKEATQPGLEWSGLRNGVRDWHRQLVTRQERENMYLLFAIFAPAQCLDCLEDGERN